ncbi:MAG TPA: hypothetical protein VGU71_15635 [Candidatus Dormibacteraeota bacterium]|nr:hypothetical protein [Candidatus Dormibacteraeota bacterium]
MKAARNLLDDPRVFDALVTLLMAGIVLSAYIDAYAHVKVPGTVIPGPATAASDALTVCWFLVTGVLFLSFGRGLRQGRPWNRALPDGYTGSLAAALVFGAALIADFYWPTAAGSNTLGLDLLFTPPHVVEIAATAVMVSGPLRSAARRGEATAGVVTLISAALLLSVFTFATQFVHPLIDPWSSNDPQQVPASVAGWVGQNLGVSGLLVQATILAGTGLLLNSGFKLRPGSLTLVFTINGFLVTITKTHFYLLPVVVAVGIAGDAWLAWTARRQGRPSASLCAVIAGAFTAADLIAIDLEHGTSWNISLWAGVIIAATMICWMIGRLLRAGLPGAPVAAPVQLATMSLEVRWTRDPQSTIRPQLVRAALDDLGTPEALGRSPLGQLPGVSRGGSAAADLRAVLIDVIGELAASPGPRDAEAGKLLLDYYVKRVGSHEVIMERLHLSRPTFYRRLQRGFSLVAERLDELSEFAQRVPVND